MTHGYDALTGKEKETLRLLLVGHDAKSIARHFGLSVHTINERLRDARRKLSVSSSREAARLLREMEGAGPQIVGDTTIGGDAARPTGDRPSLPDPAVHRSPVLRVIGGLIAMSIFAALFVLSASAVAPPQSPERTAATPLPMSAAGRAALDWLALIDDAKWAESWSATSQSFRSLNTVQAWQAASEQARVPLGRVLSRTFIGEQDTPAPPNGYRTVRFRTDFATRRGAIETLSLDREDGVWKVVGIYIE